MLEASGVADRLQRPLAGVPKPGQRGLVSPAPQRATHGGPISSFGSTPGLGTSFYLRPC